MHTWHTTYCMPAIPTLSGYGSMGYLGGGTTTMSSSTGEHSIPHADSYFPTHPQTCICCELAIHVSPRLRPCHTVNHLQQVLSASLPSITLTRSWQRLLIMCGQPSVYCLTYLRPAFNSVRYLRVPYLL